MLPRAEQKQQTRQALLDAARHLMESGRGFGSISLREVVQALTQPDVRSQLTAMGFIHIDSEFGALKLTEASRPVLRGEMPDQLGGRRAVDQHRRRRILQHQVDREGIDDLDAGGQARLFQGCHQGAGQDRKGSCQGS